MNELSELELKAVLTAGWLQNLSPFQIHLPISDIDVEPSYLSGNSVTKSIFELTSNNKVTHEQLAFVFSVMIAAGVDVATLYRDCLFDLAETLNKPSPIVPELASAFGAAFEDVSSS